ncbi:hypothetical protein CRUP_034853, partial [Coryphaenoides rupestris]
MRSFLLLDGEQWSCQEGLQFPWRVSPPPPPPVQSATGRSLPNRKAKMFLKKFFKSIVNKRDSDEDDSFEKPEFHGTIPPYPNFNPRKDAIFLEEAINSRNVDEDTIISVLVQRSNAQRQVIKQTYEESTGKSLAEELKSELRSHLEDVVLGLLMTPPQFDAFILRKATKCLGTDEDVLVEILTSRTNEEIREMERVFGEEYGESLEEVIKSETDGDFAMALLAMLKAHKNESHIIDMDLAKKDARALFEAGEEMDGIDISSLAEELKSELRSHLEDVVLGLLMTPPQFDAFILRKATKCLGTDEDVLVEILTSRTNEEIREMERVFGEEYGESLEEALFEAGEEMDGIDISVFIDILTRRNGFQLAKTFKNYSKISDVNLPKALDMELKGDIEECLIDIVKCAWSKPAFFAEKLHKAMERHGTCEDTLMRVMVSRSEVDLKKIIAEFQIMYGKSLQDYIV